MNHDDTNVRVTLVPEKAALVEGQANKLNVLAKIQVADKPESDKQQVPINMAIVIDASGSMSGQPLSEARVGSESFSGKKQPP